LQTPSAAERNQVINFHSSPLSQSRQSFFVWCIDFHFCPLRCDTKRSRPRGRLIFDPNEFSLPPSEPPSVLDVLQPLPPASFRITPFAHGAGLGGVYYKGGSCSPLTLRIGGTQLRVSSLFLSVWNPISGPYPRISLWNFFGCPTELFLSSAFFFALFQTREFPPFAFFQGKQFLNLTLGDHFLSFDFLCFRCKFWPLFHKSKGSPSPC